MHRIQSHTFSTDLPAAGIGRPGERTPHAMMQRVRTIVFASLLSILVKLPAFSGEFPEITSRGKKLPASLLRICSFYHLPGRLRNNRGDRLLGEPPPFACHLSAPDCADAGGEYVALCKQVKTPFRKIVKRDRNAGRIRWRPAADRADLHVPVFCRGDHNGRAGLYPPRR
jgi:hypothetical protein